MLIDVDDVNNVRRSITQANDDESESRARAKLDRIADNYHFRGHIVVGGDAIDREMAIEILSHQGSESFAQYMYGE